MKKKFETEAIRTQIPSTEAKEHSTPLYLTSSFLFDDAEEMRAAFADEIAKMEGAETGYAMASGMAAVFGTFAALLKSGDHLISCRAVFGATHTIFTKIFPKWNIETTYADGNDIDAWNKLVKP